MSERRPEWSLHTYLDKVMIAAEDRGLRLVGHTDDTITLVTSDQSTTVVITSRMYDPLRMLGRILPESHMQYIENGVPLVPQPREVPT